MRTITFTLTLALLGLAAANTLRADDVKSNADTKFLREAASGGMLEVKLGKLASARAHDPAVKQFGERMATDHSKGNKELMAIAEKIGVTVPTHLSKAHQATYDKFHGMKGADFDRAYMQNMVKDHEEDIADFTKEVKTGQSEQVRSFASKTLPTLQEHLQLARQVATKVGAASSR